MPAKSEAAHVRVEHPIVSGTPEVPVAALPSWEKRGWKRVEDAAPSEAPSEPNGSETSRRVPQASTAPADGKGKK